MKIIGTTLNAKYIHTNLALRFLKAFAAPEFQVEIREYVIKDPIMHIVTDLFNQNPDVIGFSCYIWNIEETCKIVQLLKKVKPTCKIILGGPEVSYNAIEWLERIPEIDAVVIGEGEATFKELLEKLANNQSLEQVAGVAFRQQDQVLLNLPRTKVNLSSIPSPYRFDEDLPHLPNRIAYFETSRGCPFNCQFCLSSIEVGVRYFDKERAKADLQYLIDNGVKTIKFMDRTFNISRSYAMDIFDFLIKNHKPQMSIQFEITADIMRPEVIAYLNEHAPAGLFRFEIGVQSTNDHTNHLVNRKQNFEKLSRIVTMIKNGGKIDQHLDLIAGLPEEDYDSFRKTFNDVYSLRPEELQLGFLKMLRGTGLTAASEQYGYQYMKVAPYEMLSNSVLPFNDVVRIKQVEDVLEKYWNDHRMDLTIEYLVREVFESAFDFFQAFGAYWEERGWSRIGQQLVDLFTRLISFIEEHHATHYVNVLNLMKFDYLSRLTHKPRSQWWPDDLANDQRFAVTQHILENSQQLNATFRTVSLLERDLQKHAVIVPLGLDIDAFRDEFVIKDCANQFLFVYYDPKSRQPLFEFLTVL